MTIPTVFADFDPTIVVDPATPLTRTDAERLLAWAVNNRRLVEAAESILRMPAHIDVTDLARSALRSCDAINAANASETERLTELLGAASIAVSPRPLDVTKLHHSVSFDIQRRDLDRALRLLSTDGYERWDPLHGAAWEMFKRTYDATTLMRGDAVGMRVELLWHDSARKGRLRRLVQPTKKDLAWGHLPAALWALYYLVRPVRVLSERLGGTRSAPDLGPFLGTPPSLIPSLLATAEVGADDVLFDIGSGDGRVLIEAAKLTGCRGVGVESSERLVARSRAAIDAAGLIDLVEIRHGDGESTRLTEATVVFAFLPANVAASLVQSVRARPGAGPRLLVHEQLALPREASPDRSTPLFGTDAVTVAHVWTG